MPSDVHLSAAETGQSPQPTPGCRSGSPIVHSSSFPKSSGGGRSRPRPRSARSLLAQRRVVLVVLDPDVLLDEPRRHAASLVPEAGPHLHGSRPGTHVLVRQERLRRHRPRPMALLTAPLENGRDLLRERHLPGAPPTALAGWAPIVAGTMRPTTRNPTRWMAFIADSPPQTIQTLPIVSPRSRNWSTTASARDLTRSTAAGSPPSGQFVDPLLKLPEEREVLFIGLHRRDGDTPTWNRTGPSAAFADIGDDFVRAEGRAGLKRHCRRQHFVCNERTRDDRGRKKQTPVAQHPDGATVTRAGRR